MKQFSCVRIILLCVFSLLLSFLSAAGEHNTLVDQGWKQWNENKREQVEQSFLSAISKDASDTRAYIGLTLLYTLQEQPEKAWPLYKQAIEKIQNPYPYIYAVWLHSMFRNAPDMEKAGIIGLLKKLTDDPNAPPSMNSMASEILGGYYEKKNDLSASSKYYRQMNAITDWMLLGALDNTSACGYDAIFPPEINYAPAAVYPGKFGSPASWFKVNSIRRDSWIDFKRYFAYDDAVFFANTFISSPIKQSVHIRIGTSGSLKAFLNDEQILSAQDENNNDLDTYIAAAELQKGWNRILIKCGHSEIESCNFMLRITDPSGKPIPDLGISTDLQSYSSKPGASVNVIPNFAEEYFKEQIKNHPEHFENYFLLASCYLRNDKAVDAEVVLRDGMKLLPNCSMFYYSLVEAKRRGKKNNEVSDIYEKMSLLDETIPSVLIYQYAQYISNEQYDEAEKKVQELNTVLPKSELVYSLSIGLYGKKNQFDKIVSSGNEAYARYPHNWVFTNLQSQIALETTKNYEPAIKIVNDYLESDFSSTPLLTLADLYLRWGKLDRYEETYNTLLELDPASPGYYRALGETFMKAQQYDKAISAFTKLLNICPNSANGWNNLGNCYRITGKPEEAKNAFRQALSFYPTRYESRESLRELEGNPSIFTSFPSSEISKIKRSAVSAKEYPDDEAVYLLDDTKRVVYPEGASEYVHEIAVKTFNSRGVDDFKEYSIGYNSYTERLTIEKAVVIKAEDRSEVKADIENNHVVFKSLEAGDIIYVRWHVKNFYAGKLSNHFWDDIYLNGYIPKKLARYSLLMPRDVRFSYRLQNAERKPSIDTLQEGVLYSWTMEDLPSIRQEADMPVLDDIGIILHISSLPDWNYIVQWYYDIARDKTRSSFEIKEQTAELFEGKVNLPEEEKIRIIYNFITEKIRYSHVSFRQSSHIPQRARDVLVQKLGDCKDVATLCIAMLKEAGIPAYHVLVNTRDEGLNRHILPSLAFNHCIVGAETRSGIKYIDLTAYSFSMESIPYADQDAFSLLIKPGVQKPFYLSDSLFAPRNISRTTHVTLKEDKSVLINRSSTRTGALAGHYRGYFRDKGTKDVEKEITSIITTDDHSAQLKDYEFKNLDFPAPTFFYRFSYLVPNYLKETGGLKILKTFWSDKLGITEALSYTQRIYPYEYFPGSDTLREELTITLPPGYKPVDLVPSTTISSPYGKYSLTYNYSKGIIRGRREFVNLKKIIPPAEYSDFKGFYDKVFQSDERNIALKKGK